MYDLSMSYFLLSVGNIFSNDSLTLEMVKEVRPQRENIHLYAHTCKRLIEVFASLQRML